jgi:DNA-binding response OmpR family regulator
LIRPRAPQGQGFVCHDICQCHEKSSVILARVAQEGSVAEELEQGMAERTAPYRLLVVEDDLNCSDLIVRTAMKSGLISFVAMDLLAIDRAIRDWRPHVITLDLCLPDIDGMEVISLIRATDFAGDVIIVSGQAEWIRNLTASIAIESGLRVPAHMSKPFDLCKLRDVLTRSASNAGHTQPPCRLHDVYGRTQDTSASIS